MFGGVSVDYVADVDFKMEHFINSAATVVQQRSFSREPGTSSPGSTISVSLTTLGWLLMDADSWTSCQCQHFL